MDEEYEELFEINKRPRWKLLLIVMVIMTVVVVLVAAILYVSVIHTSGPMINTPAGMYENVEASSSTEANIIFGIFTHDIGDIDIQLHFMANGTESGHLRWNRDAEIEWVNGPEGAEASYLDYEPTDGLINVGNMVSLTGLQPGTRYTIDVFHLPTDTTISMTGDSGEFTTFP